MNLNWVLILALATGGLAAPEAKAADARTERKSLEAAAQARPRDAAAQEAWASFLDLRREPGAAAAYERLAALAGPRSGAGARALRRLAVLRLAAGDRAGSERALEELKNAAALPAGWALGSAPVTAIATGLIEIPGPMPAFSRMAALSPDLPLEDVLLALARNVVTNGYQAQGGTEALEQTEYLKLVIRYLGQARELDKLAGPSHVLRLEACESAQTGELLKILGFRIRGGCGSEVVLETVNATRAFLSMDSGFPLTELEQALRTNKPFTHDYRPTRVPVLYKPEYWLNAKEKQAGEFIDAFLGDPSLCRLYLGLAKLDPETAEEVRRSLPVTRIRAFAHVFDFFGGMFRIRDGKVTLPGGERSLAAWADLAGASPHDGVKFVERLVTRDDGWLAAYFDALLRIHGPTAEYLTEPARLKRFYGALRGRVTSPGPARPVFRANTDLMLLTARLRLVNGRPLIPGGVDVWKRLFVEHPAGKYDAKLSKSAAAWRDPDDVLEALFGLSRKPVDNEALKIFLSLSDLERRRERPLDPETVSRLAAGYRRFGAQYLLWNESPAVTEKTMGLYLDAAEAVNGIRESGFRSDTAGTMQALAGLWQVAARQELVHGPAADALLATLVEPFTKVKSQRELLEAGRAGVSALLQACGAAAGANPQERVLDLLAGTLTPSDEETHQALVGEMLRIFEAQKLVSLKTLFDLDDQLQAAIRGEKPNAAQLNRLAARVSDLNLPKGTLTAQERNNSAFGYYSERHIDWERKLNFRAVIEKAGGQPEKLKEARGLLAPLLRDTLVGLLYVHYAPPGAQILLTNALFARSHDFLGVQNQPQMWRTTEVVGTGWPTSAGGRLVGSLSGLPYALAEAEQNFLIPTREQALIWGDLVPQLLVSSKLPRFWQVQPSQTRAVALRMQLGEAALIEGALSAPLRAAVLATLEELAPPARVRKVSDLLAAGDGRAALELTTPAELYRIGGELPARGLDIASPAPAALRALTASCGAPCLDGALSRAFGTPKPTLANSHHPELLHLRTFPTLMGYSSRILAESWESTNLYFAGLADELYLRPAQLNVMLPEWTQKTVEQIFATHLEDWPALLRSMRTIGDGLRAQLRKQQALELKASTEE